MADLKNEKIAKNDEKAKLNKQKDKETMSPTLSGTIPASPAKCSLGQKSKPAPSKEKCELLKKYKEKLFFKSMRPEYMCKKDPSGHSLVSSRIRQVFCQKF